MKKKVFFLGILMFLLVGYLASKYIYFYIQEDAIFSPSNTEYNTEEQYIYAIPVRKVANNGYQGSFIDTTFLDLKLRLPFDRKIDSINLIRDKYSFIGRAINREKQVLFHFNNDSINQNLKKSIKNVSSLVIENNFNLYNLIYSYVPDINIFMDSYEEIKYNLTLTKIKAITLPNGGDKSIYKYNNKHYKWFQFCSPKDCKNVAVQFFDKKKDYIFIFTNFTQEEIDFVLNSIK